MYLRARNYQPHTGTFTTTDPLDGTDGTTTVANPYHYAHSDPLNKTDPLGLRPTDCDGPFDTGYPGCSAEFIEEAGQSRARCMDAGGSNHDADAGTCYFPPLNDHRGEFCFPPLDTSEEMVIYEPGVGCGRWITTVGCARGPGFLDPLCEHRVGILKVSGYVLAAASAILAVPTAGASTEGIALGLSIASAEFFVASEGLDNKPCKGERVAVTLVPTMLGGGVGGAASAGAKNLAVGTTAGAVTQGTASGLVDTRGTITC